MINRSILIIPMVLNLFLPAGTNAGEPDKLVAALVRVGQPPPAIAIEKLLQAPDGAIATWPALKGKCIVLEFWATWCGPCVAAIPHLNELATHFKDKPIVFISVTNEPEAKIVSFLQRRSMNCWIGLDTDRSLFRDYRITGIPHTVLVDANGIVAGVTHPQGVSEKLIEALLAGRPLNLPVPREEVVRSEGPPADAANSSKPLFQILIRPGVAGSASTFGGSSRELRLITGSPLIILAQIYDTPVHRIDLKAELPAGPFDVIASRLPEQDDELKSILQSAVDVTFKIKSRMESRQSEVYLLSAIVGTPSKLTPSVMPKTGRMSASTWPYNMELTNARIGELRDLLSIELRTPVIDDTSLNGRYDMKLTWKGDGAEPVIQAVRDELGLELRPARRPVDFLVVENAPKVKAK